MAHPRLKQQHSKSWGGSVRERCITVIFSLTTSSIDHLLNRHCSHCPKESSSATCAYHISSIDNPSTHRQGSLQIPHPLSPPSRHRVADFPLPLTPPSPCPTLARQSREHHCSPRPKTLACPRGCQNLQSHPPPTEIVKATECPDQGTAASPTRGLSMVPVQSSARPRLPPRDSRPRIRREQHWAMCLAQTSSPALVHLA